MNLFDLYASLTLDTTDYSDGLKSAKTDTAKLESKVDDLGDSLGDMGDEAKDSGDQLDNMAKIDALNTLADAAGSVVDKITEIGQSAIDSANDIENASATAAAYLGETGEAAEATEDVIKSVYENGWGDSLDQVSEAVITVKENLGDLNDTELEDVVTQALALESSGVDMSESIRGVSSLMTQYGLTAEEAMDLYVSGVNNGLNKTDELGDNIAEYAGTFADAGYSAEEYFQLLQNGADNGAYNLDKVNDAINEATTRLEDGTIEESLDMFSDSTAEVFQAWQDGEATEKDVIESIVSDINNAESEQDALNMAAEAFGTMGEDGSLTFISALTAVGDTYSDVEGAADQFTTTLSTNASTLEGNERALQDAIAPLGELYQSALTPVVGALADIVSAIMDVVSESPALQAVIVAVTAAMVAFSAAMAIRSTIEGVKTAMSALNITMSANPIALVVVAITALVAAFVYLWNNCDEFREFWLDLWENIQEVFSSVVSAIKELVSSLKEKLTETFTAIKTSISTIVTAISTKVSSIFTAMKTAVITIFTAIKTSISTIITAIKTKINTVFTGIKTVITTIVTAIKTKITTVFTAIKTSISTIITAIKTKISTVFTAIKTSITTIITAIKTKVSTVFGGIKTSIVSIITAIQTKVVEIFTAIKTKATEIVTAMKTKISSIFTAIKTSITGIMGAIKTKISSILTNIKTAFTNAFSNIKEKAMDILNGLKDKIVSWGTTLKTKFTSIGKNLVSGLWNGISDKVSWVVDKIKGMGESITKAIKSVFGISSPSKVFAEIGGYLAEGLGVGWDDEIGDVTKSIQSDLDFDTSIVDAANSTIGKTSAASGSGGVTVTQNIYSQAQTAADLLREARWEQERAVLRGVYV